MNIVQPIRDQAVITAVKKYLRTRSLRNYLFFCFGIYSGLRVSDLLSLKVGMVKNTHVMVVEKKNDNKKKFIIHPGIRGDLNRYIAGMHNDEYLFPSRQQKKSGLRGLPIDRSTAYKILNDAAEQFNLKEIGCHTLRKTWGYQLYRQDTNNLALLMEMYNHSDPSVTLRYIGITQDMMDAAIMRLV